MVIVTTMSGCATWNADTETVSTTLPTAGENARSVILDIQFVPIAIDGDQRDLDASLWQWVDETIVDSGARQRFMDNGLRVGRLINRERFDLKLNDARIPRDVVDQFLTQASIASDVSHGDRRIPMRLGRRYELPVREPISGSNVTLLRLQEKTVGKTLQDPQYLFAVTPSDLGTGRVRLRLRPEVQHGEMRPQWISSDSALLVDRRRETWSISELDIELDGAEGDTFIVAGVTPPQGLAQQMFSGRTADHTGHRVVLIIRIDQVPQPKDLL